MFCQGYSSLPDFYQSPHISPWDLLVTSSWFPDDNCLLTWLHFMISSLLYLHSFIPRNFQYPIPCLYTATSYFIWGHICFYLLVATCALEEILIPLIIPLKIEVHHLKPHNMTSKHPVSTYIYMSLIPFLLSHPGTILLEWRNSSLWPASSIYHHIPIP